MWKYFGINLLDMYGLLYETWLVMVTQSIAWQKNEAKEGQGG